jgi:DNA-binding YbaB/EbfC family protein
MFNIGNLGELMKNAGKVRETMERATESLGQVKVSATVGGGVVTVEANGRMEVLAVRIDPKAVADGDVELLEDLVTAAVNQALAKAREAAAESLRSAAGGLTLPGLADILNPRKD